MDELRFVGGLQHLGIPCADLEESVTFYLGLGFTIKARFQNGEQNVCFMDRDGLVLELYDHEPVNREAGAINHFSLDVRENIEAVYAALQANGYHLLTDGIMELPFWERGIKYLIIEGPNGERIEFCQIL